MYTHHFNNINKEVVSYNWNDKVGLDWTSAIIPLIATKYADNLVNFIEQIYNSGEEVYPTKDRLFKAFKRCSLKDVKVVVIDNRPVRDIRSSGIGRGIMENSSLIKDVPLELRNFRDCIYETVFGMQQSITNFDNTLYEYTDNDMLFLNVSMCVTKDKDYTVVWKNFIRNIIKEINRRRKNIVYLFLTGDNNDLMQYINEDDNKIIVNSSPILMSYSTIFREVDEYIEDNYSSQSLIEW